MNRRLLFILNDAPYGSERVFNGLRVAGAVAKRDDTDVRIYLMGDAVVAAMAQQKLPAGYYHLDWMIGSASRHGADVGCSSDCMDVRGISDGMLTVPARRASLDELTDWTLWADQVVTF